MDFCTFFELNDIAKSLSHLACHWWSWGIRGAWWLFLRGHQLVGQLLLTLSLNDYLLCSSRCEALDPIEDMTFDSIVLASGTLLRKAPITIVLQFLLKSLAGYLSFAFENICTLSWPYWSMILLWTMWFRSLQQKDVKKLVDRWHACVSPFSWWYACRYDEAIRKSSDIVPLSMEN